MNNEIKWQWDKQLEEDMKKQHNINIVAEMTDIAKKELKPQINNIERNVIVINNTDEIINKLVKEYPKFIEYSDLQKSEDEGFALFEPLEQQLKNLKNIKYFPIMLFHKTKLKISNDVLKIPTITFNLIIQWFKNRGNT